MSNHTTITGNLAGPLDLRFTQSGKAVATLRVADTPRRFNKDTQQWEDAGETLWVEVSLWEAEAEALAERAPAYKGRVTVTGTLGVRYWEGKDGEKRQQITLRADSVALHADKRQGNVPGFNTDSARRSGNGYAPAGGSQADPWATDSGPNYGDQPPF